MKRYLAWFAALLFYGMTPSWNMAGAEYFNTVHHNATSDGGNISGFDNITNTGYGGTLRAGDFITKGPWVSVRSSSTLSLAHDNAVALGIGLLIDNTVSVTDNTTLTVPVWVVKGGSFSIASGKQLTINGPFSAGTYQVFSGSGSAKFGYGSVKEVYLEWWGGKGDLSTINDSAFASALASDATKSDAELYFKSQRTLRLLTGQYLISSAITVPNRVTIEGSGSDSTQIQAGSDNTDFFIVSNSSGVRIRNLTLAYGGSGSGAGIRIGTAGGTGDETATSDLIVENVGFWFLYTGIQINDIMVHMEVKNCVFAYNQIASVNIADGAQPSTVLFQSNRFEASYAGAFASVGNAGATSNFKFINNIFEAQRGTYTVDVGNNAFAYTFIGNHFEVNAYGKDNGADIAIGFGSEGIVILGNVFTIPWTTAPNAATNFYSIRAGQSSSKISIEHNMVTATQGAAAGYLGFFEYSGVLGRGAILRDNFFTDRSFNYLGPNARLSQIYTQMDKPNGFGWNTDGLFAYKETTDATPAVLWSYTDVRSDIGTYNAYYVIADVVAVSSDNAIRAAYTVRSLLADDNTTLTLQGSASETAIETTAGMDCAFAASSDSNGTIQLNVTGVAATTIRWSASIRIVSARH